MSDVFPWLTRRQAADLVRLGTKQLDDALRPRLPEGAERGTGKTLRINAVDLTEALVAYRLDQVPKPPIDGDPLMGGGDSPWLEEYRKQRAGQEAIKLSQMRGSVVTVDELEPVLTQFASTIRQTGDVLQRRFGPDAATVLNEGIDEAVSVTEKFLSDVRRKSDAVRDSQNRDAVAHPAAADDARVRGSRNPPSKRPARRPPVQD